MNANRIIKFSVIGAAAGLASTFIMTKFQAGAGELESALRKKESEGENKQKNKKEQSEKSDPATVKLANKISRNVAGHKIKEENKETAGSIVHYGFGTSVGALFGLLNLYLPQKKIASGLLYGVGVWAIADNVLVPLMGLSKGPLKQSFKTQAYALTSHLVYGGALSTLLKQEQKLEQTLQ